MCMKNRKTNETIHDVRDIIPQSSRSIAEGAAGTRISDLPQQERPYEKCERFGVNALTDAELLAVLLRTGAEGASALTVSRSLLASLGSEGLAGLHKVSMEDLLEIRGIGKVKSVQILCIAELSRRIAQAKIGREDDLIYNDPEVIGSYYMEQMRHESQEIVLLLCLSSKGRLLSKKVISRGDIYTAILNPREVFAEALSHRAVSIILLHNHPSGDPTPSREDVEITRRIYETGKMVGIPLTDHLVIGDKTFVSMRRSHLLSDDG